MAKIASIWHSDAYLRILNIISMNLSVFHDLKNPEMSLGKPQIWQKIENFAKIIKNQQMLVFVTIPLIFGQIWIY